MPKRRNACRPVELADGQVVIVRGDRELKPDQITALGEIVAAAQRLHEQHHRTAPDAAALWARIDNARRPAGISLREVSAACGVPFRVLFRLAQGVMCGPHEQTAIEEWLASSE